MREIKFRVWNSVSKYMHDHGWLTGANVVYSALSNPAKYNHVMQFTGLKDKNGKDIYEGDILCVSNFEFDGYVNYGNPDSPGERYIDCKGKVSFDEAAFFFDGHSAGEIPLHAIDLKDTEVIGNIHQNPELL